MTLERLSIVGAYVSSHQVFPDERGLFREWFKFDEIQSIDKNFSVQQANYSKSKNCVIRGVHYSLAPQGQAKVVTCASGTIVDVLVDLRVGSPSYLIVDFIELAEDSGHAVYIPSGVGHGFLVKTEAASVVYLTSSKYAPEFEKGICPTDPELGIEWPIESGRSAIISKQDRDAQSLEYANKTGNLPRFSN
jgi:dTDP-4-dehydrorhamnose 3,5-epimerase